MGECMYRSRVAIKVLWSRTGHTMLNLIELAMSVEFQYPGVHKYLCVCVCVCVCIAGARGSAAGT